MPTDKASGYGNQVSPLLQIESGDSEILLDGDALGFDPTVREMSIWVDEVNAADTVAIQMRPSESLSWFTLLEIDGSLASQGYANVGVPVPPFLRVTVVGGNATSTVKVQVLGKHLGPERAFK